MSVESTAAAHKNSKTRFLESEVAFLTILAHKKSRTRFSSSEVTFIHAAVFHHLVLLLVVFGIMKLACNVAWCMFV